MKKFTPQHFPVGTLVELDGCSFDDGYDEGKPVGQRFYGGCIVKVRKVISPECYGPAGDACIEIDVKNTERAVSYGLNKYYIISVRFVRRIVKVGHGLIIETPALVYRPTGGSDDLLTYIVSIALRTRPGVQIKCVQMREQIVRSGYAKEIRHARYNYLTGYVFSKKKVKAWVVRNINRYIVTEKEKEENKKRYLRLMQGSNLIEPYRI